LKNKIYWISSVDCDDAGNGGGVSDTPVREALRASLTLYKQSYTAKPEVDMKVKKYMLFAGARYYPQGGMEDFVGFYDSMEDALEAVRKGRAKYDWYDVVDTPIFNEGWESKDWEERRGEHDSCNGS